MFKLNLQLFAEDGGEPIPESTEEPSPNVDEEVVDSVNEDSDTSETEEPVKEEGTKLKEADSEEQEFIPKADVQKIVSKRVNELNEKYSDYDKYKQNMERLIKMSGLTEDQFYKQLEEVEIQSKAKQMGVSPEVAKQMEESQRALQEAQKTTLDMKYQMEEQALQSNPLYEDYDKVKDEVRELASKSGMSLEQAYWATNGPSLVEKQTKLTEQRVSHNNKYKQQRGTVENEGNDKTPPTPGASLTDAQKKMAEQLGMSADEYAIYNDDDLSYDKIVEMRNKK